MVFQGQEQFLWIASSETIQRFDGRNVYKHAFPGNIAQAFCDNENRIWVLSQHKVWRSTNDRWGFAEIPFDTLAGGRPCAIFQLKDQPPTILSTKGFFTWETDKAIFQAFPLPFPPAVSSIRSMQFDTFGTTIFYPVKKGYVAADLATGIFHTIPEPAEFFTFCALSPDDY
ncbi:MAG: hypothetical protein KDC34_15050 [Saprospiraceae bacterium]|nr:hypothetical protein [Saprospiraceae bacterium]